MRINQVARLTKLKEVLIKDLQEMRSGVEDVAREK